MAASVTATLRERATKLGTQVGIAFGLTAATLTGCAADKIDTTTAKPPTVNLLLDLLNLQGLGTFGRTTSPNQSTNILPPSALIANMDLNNMSDPYKDPVNLHKVVFMTPGVSPPSWPYEEINIHKYISPYAAMVDIPAHNMQDAMLAATQRMVDQRGTLDEIVVNSHGGPHTLFGEGPQSKPDSDPTTLVNVKDFLNAFIQLQKKLGKQISKRMVFMGCDVMTNMGPEWVKFFRQTAQTLHTEIVGTTTIRWGNGVEEAGFVHFTPDGNVSRDQLNASPSILKRELAKYNASIRSARHSHLVPLIEDSDTWFSCHQGKTQQEGAACQDQLSRRNMRLAEEYGYASKSDTFVALVPRIIPYSLRLSSLGAQEWGDIYQEFYKPTVKRKLSEGRRTEIQDSDISRAQSMINQAYNLRSAFYDTSAVRAHEKFIRSLSPQGQKAVIKIVEDYVSEHSPSSSFISLAEADGRNFSAVKPHMSYYSVNHAVAHATRQ